MTRTFMLIFDMATKLKVILQRVEAKDYLDIAAMLKAGIRLDYGLAAARLVIREKFSAQRMSESPCLF